MHKVGIIGHYGFGLDLANGQTIKTKIVTEYVSKIVNNDLITIDAHGGVKAIFPVVLGCIKCLFTCHNVIILLTENGLRVTVPVLTLINRIFHRRLHYVVIGGWLSDFLTQHRSIEKKLKRFDYIYVETNTMKKALESKCFSNIVIMPNCKQLSILDPSELQYFNNEPYPICTFSRVMKEKGIETLVEVIKRINEEHKRTIYNLDIYGQVDSGQIEWFENLKGSFPTYISYGGVIPFERSVEVLKNYFLLVFPTHFYTEGIPGTIIDAYAAGVPVVSAKWESFDDVVDENRTGLGYTFDNLEELYQLLLVLVNNPNIINNMRNNCLAKSSDYLIENSLSFLISRLK